MDVVMTGATGFVGRALMGWLLDAGHRVHALLRDPADSAIARLADVRTSCFDLLSEAGDTPDFSADALVHLAWPDLDDYNSLSHVESALPASYRVVKAALDAGVRRVLVTGTCQEYGLREGALAADTPTEPQTSYAVAKDGLHRQLRLLAPHYGADIIWARLFYLHGPGQRSKSLFAQLEAAVARGDARFDMSPGEQLRDYIHVTEAARQLCDALETAPDGPVNICSGTPRSVRGLVEDWLTERGAGITLNPGHFPYPSHEPMACWGRKGA